MEDHCKLQQQLILEVKLRFLMLLLHTIGIFKVLFSAPSTHEENLDHHEKRSSRTDTPVRSPLDPNTRRTGPGAGKQTMKESVKRRLDVRSGVYFLKNPPPPLIINNFIPPDVCLFRVLFVGWGIINNF